MIKYTPVVWFATQYFDIAVGKLMLIIITIALILTSSLLAMDCQHGFCQKYRNELAELSSKLADKEVPVEWFYDNIHRDGFEFHDKIDQLFSNMTENRFKRGEIDISDYKQHFGVDLKVKKGVAFMNKHKELLLKLEAKNGIHYEIVLAILGMETNFGEQRQRGRYKVFDALVSQYILMPNRQRFAVNEIAALYTFSQKTEKPIDYFVGSFAGASGWGQFVPTSLVAYFVSADGIDKNTDIFSIEDTLFSIENYLAAHRLNGRTIKSEESLQKAVYAYNRSDAYVKAVIYIYEELKKQR